MSTTTDLTDTGLPMTHDGWTVEVLDTDDAGAMHNEVGGDYQVLSEAPSFRARFVSTCGDVVVVTHTAYVIAFATERATADHGLIGMIDVSDHDDMVGIETAERAAYDAGVLDDAPEPLVVYGYDVVTEVDRWSAGNTDEELPDYEDVEYNHDLGSVFDIADAVKAQAEAGAYVRDAAATAARDWYPSNF